ncbi:unannotated protein [freshwater metagenome]|uniref:Unannotated protein n=1 Tax=freshwater metagenome TaxID=449393 RepID=A0A6J7FR11_9ZZZZ|nr:molybdopterin-dependent oxidoreductase [Actinomycetota bacterium]MSW98914.1 molybdopterin-dependent oxidoreductase [Actinomycetota bacterium]MSY82585.1 molybdopterin-dependent oxidoreductase [Actinomycetota bacterium]MTA22886.1 molybdopterin-dependent oxidoreductase [Actinomycetota bacterium]
MNKSLRLVSHLSIGAILLASVTIATSASGAITKASVNPYGASSIDPAALTDVILTLSSKGVTKKYIIADLEKMATKVITINEPFVKKVQKFNVIPLSQLFAKVKISPKQKVVTLALNDYAYANTAGNFLSAQGYLAVLRNGEPIPYDQGGPIRIIFPDNSKWAKNLDPWNWSLQSITAK